MRSFGAKWTKAVFRGCKMDLADMKNSRFEGCRFERCEGRLADFMGSHFEDCVFEACNFEQARFASSYMRAVTFTECRMTYAEQLFQAATFRAPVTFTNCNFHGSNLDFRETDEGTPLFESCNLWSAKASFGCAFWRSRFDERMSRMFIAMIARNHPNASVRATLRDLAGPEAKVVARAMSEKPADG